MDHNPRDFRQSGGSDNTSNVILTPTNVTGTETDTHARVKLMKNMNKPLPDGGAALPTSETGQRRVEI